MPIGPTKTKEQKANVVRQEMHKFKGGTLHSGSPTGPVVSNPKQAIAIALSESGQSRNAKLRQSGHPNAHKVGHRGK